MRTLILALSILILTLSSGCSAAARLVSPDLVAQVATEIAPEVTTDIGGDGDSVALWLAILAPLFGSLLYQFGFRRIRIWRENGIKYIKATNGGRMLCLGYRQDEVGIGASGSASSPDSSGLSSGSSSLSPGVDAPSESRDSAGPSPNSEPSSERSVSKESTSIGCTENSNERPTGLAL